MTNQYSFIEFKYPKDAAMWDRAEEICGGTNLSSADALHLAAAIEIGCNILVTTDKDFITIASNYIKGTVPPSEVDLAIAKLNH
jgi:predicted nucleic acid-binding protein